MIRFNRNIDKYGMFTLVASLALVAASAVVSAPAVDQPSAEMQAQLAKLRPEDRQMILSYTPELRQKFLALSPELRATLGKLHASHTRHSQHAHACAR